MLPIRVAGLVYFRPNFIYLATFQVGWPKKISWPFFWPHLTLAGLKQYVWPFGCFLAIFTLKQVPMKKNIAVPFFSALHLQNFCDKCCGKRPHSDISNIWGMLDSKLGFAWSLEMCALTALRSVWCFISTKQSQHLQTSLRLHDRNAIITSKWKDSCECGHKVQEWMGANFV